MSTSKVSEPFRDGRLMLNDAQEAHRRLENDADRLFAPHATKVVVWPGNELDIPSLLEKCRMTIQGSV